jgi:hypothetical protein
MADSRIKPRTSPIAGPSNLALPGDFDVVRALGRMHEGNRDVLESERVPGLHECFVPVSTISGKPIFIEVVGPFLLLLTGSAASLRERIHSVCLQVGIDEVDE